MLTFLGGSILAAGGAAAYAKYDPKFQNTLEQNLPYAEEIFRFIPEWKTPPYVHQEERPEQAVKEVKDKGLVAKKLERDNTKKQETSMSVPDMTKQPATEEKAKNISSPKTQPKEKEISVEKKLDDHRAKEEKLLQKEADIISMNAALQQKVEERLQSLEKLLKDAVTAEGEAVEAVRIHTQKLYTALNETSDVEENRVWDDISAANVVRDAAISKASTIASDVKTAAEELRSTISEGRANKYTSQNPSLLPAEERVSKILYEVQSAETEMARALGEARVVNEYKDIVEKGKEKFKKELEAALPDVKLGEKGHKLTEEELNFLIAHAHRRVEQLQRRLAKQMVTEHERIQKAMEKQQEEDSKIADARVAVELANQQRELEINYQKDVDNLKEEFEHELRQQLRRQAAAHSDHLQEVLLTQQKELSRKHDEELKEKVLQERTRQLSEMAESMRKLKGIEDTLKAREELDEAAKKAQKLWLACQALKQSVKCSRPDEEGFGQPKPLDNEITAIEEAAEKDKPFVAAVLASIPEDAIRRGVYTEESLKERFHKVNKVCRRVALIDENGGSLYKHLVSYLQSLLVIESAKLPAGEMNKENEVDPSKWDTFDILTRIRHSLDHEDLEQALRYANQLKGEPRNVARDWINELRLLLETRQAAEALIAHAAAVSVQAYH